jgi:hypothetical protein
MHEIHRHCSSNENDSFLKLSSDWKSLKLIAVLSGIASWNDCGSKSSPQRSAPPDTNFGDSPLIPGTALLPTELSIFAPDYRLQSCNGHAIPSGSPSDSLVIPGCWWNFVALCLNVVVAHRLKVPPVLQYRDHQQRGFLSRNEKLFSAHHSRSSEQENDGLGCRVTLWFQASLPLHTVSPTPSE